MSARKEPPKVDTTREAALLSALRESDEHAIIPPDLYYRLRDLLLAREQKR